MAIDAKNKNLPLRKGVMNFSLYALFLLFLNSPNLCAEEISTYTGLSSQSCSQAFYNIASEISKSEDLDKASAKQAVIFFEAASELNGTESSNIISNVTSLINRHSFAGKSELVYRLLGEHLNQNANRSIIKDAVKYLLNTANNREQREILISLLSQNFGGKNSYLDSEMATSIGILREELSDPNAAVYFLNAYRANRYNRLAYAKIAELAPQYISPELHLEHYRLRLGENPLDLQSALVFADYARKIELYQISSDAYQYSIDLFSYLYPSQKWPAYIYLPWVISAYNTERNQYKCLQIASRIQQQEQFDVIAQSYAAKAAEKMGDMENASRILSETEQKAKQLFYASTTLTDMGKSKGDICRSLAWFYCFAKTEPNQAIEWAKRTYDIDPNNPTSNSLYAYSLLMNLQTQQAEQLALKSQENQIANLVIGRIQLSRQQNEQAIETLKTAISKDPGSLEAQVAKNLMLDAGQQYIPALNAQQTTALLSNSLMAPVVPTFVNPQKMFSVQLSLRGTKFDYGKDFDASLIIKNDSTEPLIISDNSIFTGNIRIDARLKGDINTKIENLVSMKYQPTEPIRPGRTVLLPITLYTGRMKQILENHPQASVGIEFTVYLDPVETSPGKITNRLVDIEPVKYRISRMPVIITSQYLQLRIESITKGQTGQKINNCRMFAGLLNEQREMAKARYDYKYVRAPWMRDTLTSVISYCLKEENWEIKTPTMAALRDLNLNSDMLYRLANDLNSTKWPVRLMALYLLEKNSKDFQKVLDWSARYDSSSFVRDMAIALGADVQKEETDTFLQRLLLERQRQELLRHQSITPPVEQTTPAGTTPTRTIPDANTPAQTTPIGTAPYRTTTPTDSNTIPNFGLD